MRLIVLALLALGSPAIASQDPLYEGYHVVPNAPHHGRTYVYFGHDDRWGPRVFSRDDGYFQGRGGGVSVENGRAVYAYDRDYLYDFPRGWGGREERLGFTGDELLAEEPDCRVERVPDRRSGSAEVRICS